MIQATISRYARLTRPWALTGMIASLLMAGCSIAPERPESAAWPEYETDAAQAFASQCRTGLESAQAQLEKIENGHYSDSTDRLLDAINELDIVSDRAVSRASLYFNVHPDAQVREAAATCRERAVELFSNISLSRPLYQQVADIEIGSLNGLEKRYVEEMLEGFKRSGVDRDEATRQRIRALNEQLNKLGQTFGRNINQDVRSVAIKDAHRLEGLPQDFIDNHPPNENGDIVITTDYPDYLPVMQYAQDDELRLELYREFRRRGYPDNELVLRDILEARYELAQLLGYDTYADYVTENKMIRSADNAQEFIDQIAEIAKPRSDAEYDKLLARLRKIDPSASFVGDWQKTHLQELVKKEQFEVDAQQVRQYFRYEAVRDGIFDLTETLFGVTIKPWETDSWHEDVEAYEMWQDDELLGRFYLDMHPRDGKYKHAAAFSLQDGVKGIQEPIKALVCNFPGAEGPGYMEHSQVETFLHEFGHLLHGIFAGDQPWLSFSGIKTEWDFVEAPSQMLEEWVWDADTLKSFARNSEGELIPEELVRKMNLGRDFGQGLFARHQMFYAAISLNLYDRDPAEVDFDALIPELQSEYSPFPFVDGTYFHTSFGHLYGYSAIYYTYMWSKVIASDMFSEFKREGLRNTEVARRYREEVLAPGGTEDAAVLVENFLGRPYSFDAFAEELSPDVVEEVEE
ncbi:MULTISPECIES: M3 family metallopeptidase [unclassified Marinimicrobium]|uniref:M3 family metallopeptidase n=1 Tax=unclassified Marinimicrobium TaxID=2632100 RepID=UPI00258024A5|nr:MULTISPECIES: M3 family metallopeptidase [unclassified Marinimicrobium]